MILFNYCLFKLSNTKPLLNLIKISSPNTSKYCTDNSKKSVRDIREQILNKSIELVSESGWSQDTLTRAAKALGYPPQLHGIVDGGSLDLIYYFHETRTQLMSRHLDEFISSANESKEQLNTRTILFEGVKYRLGLLEPVIGRWPEAMVQLAYPVNVGRTGWLLRELFDELWIKAGDKSTDMSWYSKRAVLAGVYSATELFMLQDKSLHYTETWRFLDRRLDEAECIGHVGITAKNFFKDCKENCRAVNQLLRNVSGIYRN